ncbi:MAG: hypothetical protein M0Z28_21695 [Rhodospirillales bacterium]|nr:hypothetical protein [Rhodospirillales bacterium]
MLIANTMAMTTMTSMPNLPAAKKAGMPSTIGDEPRISIRAVRDDVFGRCLCGESTWSCSAKAVA